MKIVYLIAVVSLVTACAPPQQAINDRELLVSLLARKGQTRTYPAGLTAEQFILQTDPIFADPKNRTLLTAYANASMGTFVGGACPMVISKQELAALRAETKGATGFMQKLLMTMHGMTPTDAMNRLIRVGDASLQEFQDRNYITCPPEVRTAFKNGKDGATFINQFAWMLTGRKWSDLQ